MASVNCGKNEDREKICKHCKKKVSTPWECESCKSGYHPSCAQQAKITNSENRIISCRACPKSGVRGDENIEIDETKLKNIVKSLLKEYLSPLKKDLQDEMKEIRKSIQFMSDSFDEHKAQMDQIFIDMKAIKDENKYLKQQIVNLESKINAQEQMEKRKNIVMVGIPKQESDVITITRKIVKALKPQALDEIVDAYRVGKQENGPIIMKLRNEITKHEILKTIREKRGMKTSECGLIGNERIYFNEDLTQCNQVLYKKAREYKKQKKLKSVYCLNGKIYLRHNDDDPPVRIKCEDDLKHL